MKTTDTIPSDVDTRTEDEKEADRIEAEKARDAEGANLIKAEGDGAIAVNGRILTPTSLPELGEGWDKVLVVANATSADPKRGYKVIVAQARSQPDENGEGAGLFAETKYPKADAYVGWDEGTEDVFGKVDGPVLLVGRDLVQMGLKGLSHTKGYVCVGPAHPVYAAVNLAFLQGAKTVVIEGLTDYDKTILAPWLDKIAEQFDKLTF